MERYASALVPDFAQFYGLRLTQVVADYHPAETVLLISGLPGTSRYAARLAGEDTGTAWNTQQWLALDTRNAIEALRVTVASMAAPKKKQRYREWEHYPGYTRQQEQTREQKMESLRARAQIVKG